MADFQARNLKNFLASDDEWTSPIAAEVGPEGALWVIDWYNYIIQHNPTPAGFKNGKGNAYETPLRDKVHGRIYRVVHKASQPSPIPARLEQASPVDLVATLKNNNMLWRTHAQRLLVERGQKDVLPALYQLIRQTGVDEIGLNPAANHALWTLQGLGVLKGDLSEANEVVVAALKHPSAGVRRNAIQVMPRTEAGRDALLGAKVLQDADAQVRLAAFLALADQPASDAAAGAVFAALQEERNATDRWLTHAATSAAAHNANPFLKAALVSKTATETALAGGSTQVLRSVAGHLAQAGSLDSVRPLLASFKGASRASVVAILEGFAAAWPKDKIPVLTAADETSLRDTMAGLPPASQPALLILADSWNRKDLFAAQSSALVKDLATQVADESLSSDARVAAAKRWIGFDDQPATVEGILKGITLESSAALAGGLISAIGNSQLPQTGELLIQQWSTLTPISRRAALGALLRRAPWATALLQAVDGGKLVRSDLAAEHWQQLKHHSDKTVSALAKKLGGGSAVASSADMEALAKKLMPLSNEKGNVTHGLEVFEKNCIVCHTFNGKGAKIGPELTGVGARPRSEVLLDIIDPNRSVEANFRLWTVTTKEGDSYSGRLDTETQTTIEIMDLAGQKHLVQRKAIKSLEASALSIMPSGFEALPETDLRDLLEFLAQSGLEKH